MEKEKIFIRKAKIEDCKQVYELCKTKELINPSGEPPKLWWIKSFIKEKQIFYVAQADGKVIGFVIGERTCGEVGYLWMLAVKKENRGKGIAKQLLLCAEQECKKRGLRVIVSYGFAESKKVLNLLKKLKYEKGRKYFEFIKFL